MGLFDRFKKKPLTRARTEKASPQRQIVSTISPERAVVTAQSFDKLAVEGYKRNIIAFRSIDILAKSVARIPLRLTKGDNELDTHPLLSLLARPNPRKTWTSYVESMVGCRMIGGNAYTLAVGTAKAVRELWLMRPDQISIIVDGKSDIISYRQKAGGKVRDFDATDVFHWKTFNPLDDLYGMGPLEAAALAADTHNEGSRWNLAVIQNGGAPSGVLYQDSAEEALTDQQFDALKQQIDEDAHGAKNVGRPLLLEGGFKWQQLGLSPRDMDWLEGKKMSATEIAMAFGVPAQMVGIQDSQTYSNMQEARAAFWQDVVIPLAHDLVGELNAWLVPQFGDNLRLDLNTDDLPALEYVRASRFERIDKAQTMTINEKRDALGLVPIGAEGDVILVPATMMPLGEDIDDIEAEDPEEDPAEE